MESKSNNGDSCNTTQKEEFTKPGKESQSLQPGHGTNQDPHLHLYSTNRISMMMTKLGKELRIEPTL